MDTADLLLSDGRVAVAAGGSCPLIRRPAAPGLAADILRDVANDALTR
jgi:hypothetical protein